MESYYQTYNAEDPDAFPCILVGNKCDIGERATNLEEVLAWCAEKRPKRPITHIECSALRSIAVNDIFIIVAFRWTENSTPRRFASAISVL